ncbi:MAG: hypothetical protein ACYCSO_03985 [Cuniculiplasma sp.]
MDKNEYTLGMKQVEKLLNREKYTDALTLLNGLMEKGGDEKEMKADILSKISEAYYGKEGVKTDNAISNLIESLKIRSELNQPEILALEMMNLAYLQDESGSLENAEKTLKEAMEVADQLEDITLTLSLKNALADILSEDQKNTDESIRIYTEIMNDSDKDQIWEIYYEACVSLIKLLRDRGKMEEANDLSVRNIEKAEKTLTTFKTKKEKEEFKDTISYLYDVSIDLAMENEDIGRARDLAEKFKGEK